MRLVLEFVIVAALLFYGWEESFRDRVDEWRGRPAASHSVRAAAARKATAPRQPFNAGDATDVTAAQPAASASVPGSWMWDKNRHGALDRPVDDGQKSFSGHIFYKDLQGKAYWLDGSGIRHYEP